MDSQPSERARDVGARSARVESEMAAARRALQDKRSESQVALDTAVERMLADVGAADRAQPGAVEETAPAVHAVSGAAVRVPAPRP